jgi:hypothetical protein
MQGGYIVSEGGNGSDTELDRPLTRGERRADAARKWLGMNNLRLPASVRPVSAVFIPAPPVVRHKRYRGSATMRDQHMHKKHLLVAQYTMFGA